MRTAIYFGCLCISDAIRANWLEKGNVGFMAFVGIVFIVMDMIDFITDKFKK